MGKLEHRFLEAVSRRINTTRRLNKTRRIDKPPASEIRNVKDIHLLVPSSVSRAWEVGVGGFINPMASCGGGAGNSSNAYGGGVY